MADHDGGGWLDEEAVADLRAELAALPSWKLGAQRWDEVIAILSRLTDALAHRDRAAVREAATELALAGPVRVTRIGAGQMPPPAEVLERRAVLEHTLIELEHTLVEPTSAPDDDR